MGQFSLAAVLIIRLPDEVLSSMARDDLLTLVEAMQELAGRPETDAALERLSQVVAMNQSAGRSAVAPALKAVQPPRRKPEARAVSRASR